MPWYSTPQSAGSYSPPVLSPLAQQAFLRSLARTQLGKKPKEPDTGWLSFLPDPIERTIMGPAEMGGLAAKQIGESLIYALPGLIETGMAVGKDLTVESQEGNFFPNTRRLGEAMGRAIVEDVTNPAENPGYLLMDIISAASLGAGGALRVAQASRAARTGLEARAIAAGRRPSPEPESAHIPGTPDEPPLVQQPGMAELPSRTVSDIGGIPVKNRPPVDLTPGKLYRVRNARGEVFDQWEYVRTSGLYTQKRHYFKDPTGRPRSISDRGLYSVTVEQLPRPKGAGPQMGTSPSGKAVDAFKRWTTPGEKITVQEARKLEKEGLLPEGEANKILAEQQIDEAAKATPEPTTPETLAWSRVGRDRMGANVVEGTAFHIVPEQGLWRLLRVEAGGKETPMGKPYNSYLEALDAGNRAGALLRKPPSGAAQAPSLLQVAGSAGRALLSRPLPTERQIIKFEKQEPRYGEFPGEATALYTTEGGQRRAAPVERKLAEHGTPVQTYAKKLDEEMQLFPEETRTPTNLVERWDPKTKSMVLDTGELVPAHVMLSRNPIVRRMQNMQLDFMERHPDSRVPIPGPYMGRNLTQIHRLNVREAERALRDSRGGEAEAEAQTAATRYEEFRRAGMEDKALAVLDSMNMMAKLWVLYFKPAYYTANMIGQMMLTSADHAWNPQSMAKTVRLQWDMHKNRTIGAEAERRMKDVMGEGVSLHFQGEAGIGLSAAVRQRMLGRFSTRVQRLGSYEQMAEFANRILDTPFRNNAFIHQARLRGYDTGDKINDLLLNPELEGELRVVAREANRNIIDYARLGPAEKRWIRRIVFFYPWFKGATLYTGRFISQHPAQAQIATRMGQEAQREAKAELGPIPSYLSGAGVFKVGERDVPGVGKVPTILNPQSAGVIGTAGEAGAAIQNLLFGGAGEASDASQFLTPALSAALAGIFRRDPFTGAEFPRTMGAPEIMARQLADVPSVLRMLGNIERGRKIESGELDASEILHPYNTQEAVGRFGFGMFPYAMNQNVARSRAFAELRSLQSLREREILNAREYQRQYLEAGRETGTFQQLPEPLRDALGARGEREAELAAYGESLGRDLNPIDRLTAELNLLVRQGKVSQEQGKQLLTNMLQANEAQVQRLRQQLSEVYWNTDVISRYRSYLNQRGAELTV